MRFFHTTSDAKSVSTLKQWFKSSASLRSIIHFFLIVLLTLFAFAAAAAAGSKDPTLRGLNSSAHTALPNGLPHTKGSKIGSGGVHPASGRAKSEDLGSQLMQIENSKGKGATGRQTHSPRSKDTKRTPRLTARSESIDLRSKPQRRVGVSNQQGNGSGSKRYGAGRRITEAVH